jgi:hypothetical protein
MTLAAVLERIGPAAAQPGVGWPIAPYLAPLCVALCGVVLGSGVLVVLAATGTLETVLTGAGLGLGAYLEIHGSADLRRNH